MRAKYYTLGLRQMKREKSFVFFVFWIIFFSTITTLYTQKFEPVLYNFTQANAYTLAMNATEEAILEIGDNIDFNSIISKEYGENGNLRALCVNTNELNKISNELTIKIGKNISSVPSSKIKVPLALLFDTGIFGGTGVKLIVKTVPLGDTKVECISEFDSTSINSTRHRIILNVNTYYTIVAPVYIKNECYHKEVVLAETIINGDIPNSYTSLDLTKSTETITLP